MGAHQLLEGCHFVQLRPKGAVEDYVGAVVETVCPQDMRGRVLPEGSQRVDTGDGPGLEVMNSIGTDDLGSEVGRPDEYETDPIVVDETVDQPRVMFFDPFARRPPLVIGEADQA
jgi:hypothetical protein